MMAPGFTGSMLVIENDVVRANRKLAHVFGSSVSEVQDDVRRQLGLSFPIKLLVLDADFDEFVRVENLAELPTKAKVRVERANPTAAAATAAVAVAEGGSSQGGVMRFHGGGARKDFVAMRGWQNPLSSRSSALGGMLSLADDGAADADGLVHTRSAIADLEQRLSPAEARKAQSERKQLRAVEADLSELRAECARREILRGPSGRRCGDSRFSAARVAHRTHTTFYRPW
jgi:hypothetical protein